MICCENTLVRTGSLGMHVKTKLKRPQRVWKGECTLSPKTKGWQTNFVELRWNTVQTNPCGRVCMDWCCQTLTASPKREVRRRIDEPTKGGGSAVESGAESWHNGALVVSHVGLVSQDISIQCLWWGTKDRGQDRRRVEVSSWTTEVFLRPEFSEGSFGWVGGWVDGFKLCLY